ncbi:MAG: hypothetical protein M9947_07265 [Thermomicrobiales bacterium]|nr:hypothetical protein [Thermomicrobiales bacterium]
MKMSPVSAGATEVFSSVEADSTVVPASAGACSSTGAVSCGGTAVLVAVGDGRRPAVGSGATSDCSSWVAAGSSCVVAGSAGGSMTGALADMSKYMSSDAEVLMVLVVNR